MKTPYRIHAHATDLAGKFLNNDGQGRRAIIAEIRRHPLGPLFGASVWKELDNLTKVNMQEISETSDTYKRCTNARRDFFAILEEGMPTTEEGVDMLQPVVCYTKEDIQRRWQECTGITYGHIPDAQLELIADKLATMASQLDGGIPEMAVFACEQILGPSDEWKPSLNAMSPQEAMGNLEALEGAIAGYIQDYTGTDPHPTFDASAEDERFRPMKEAFAHACHLAQGAHEALENVFDELFNDAPQRTNTLPWDEHGLSANFRAWLLEPIGANESPMMEMARRYYEEHKSEIEGSSK